MLMGILWVALWRYPRRYPPHIPHVAMTTICGFYREFYRKMPGTMIFLGFFLPWGGSKGSQAELDNRPQLCIDIYIYILGVTILLTNVGKRVLADGLKGAQMACCFPWGMWLVAAVLRRLKVVSFGQPSEIRDVQNDFVDTLAANSVIKIARKKS